MASEVVGIGDTAVACEEELAHGHRADRGEQATCVEAARLPHAVEKERGGDQVQGNQRVLKADLECRQPFACYEGARQRLRVDEKQRVQRRHKGQYRGEYGPSRPCHVPRVPGQGDCQQCQGAQQPSAQPELDGLFRGAGRDEVRHARVGQHVRKIQHPHPEEGTGQQQGVVGHAFTAQAPHHAKDQRRDSDGQSLQCHVQRQVAGRAAEWRGQRSQQDQRQEGRQGNDRRQRKACFGLVAGVQWHGVQRGDFAKCSGKPQLDTKNLAIQSPVRNAKAKRVRERRVQR